MAQSDKPAEKTEKRPVDPNYEIWKKLPAEVKRVGISHPDWPCGLPDQRNNVVVMRLGSR